MNVYDEYVKIFIIGVATVMVWHGIWTLLDKYMENSANKALLNILIGLVILSVVNNSISIIT